MEQLDIGDPPRSAALTSGLRRAAAHQLEVVVVRAEVLALQMLEQLSKSGPDRVGAVQVVAFGALFDLEVFILEHKGRLHHVELRRKMSTDRAFQRARGKIFSSPLIYLSGHVRQFLKLLQIVFFHLSHLKVLLKIKQKPFKQLHILHSSPKNILKCNYAAILLH